MKGKFRGEKHGFAQMSARYAKCDRYHSWLPSRAGYVSNTYNEVDKSSPHFEIHAQFFVAALSVRPSITRLFHLLLTAIIPHQSPGPPLYMNLMRYIPVIWSN